MLETPSIRCYSSQWAVKTYPVRAISRKDRTQCSESSETNTPGTCKGEDRVRAAWRHAESSRNDSTPLQRSNKLWQSRQPGRRENQAQTINFTGKLAEWNANSVPVVFGGGAVSGGTYAFPSDTDSLNEFAGVIDVIDSSDKFRFVFYRANQTGTVESQFNRTSLATLSFEFGVLAPAGGGVPVRVYTNAIT